MTVYSRIGFRVLDVYPASVEALLKPFSIVAKEYLLDEGMRLYRVPWNSEAYDYIRRIKALLKEGDYFEMIETEYCKADYEKAAAYFLRFKQIIYGYGDVPPMHYFEMCCKGGSVYKRQAKNYMVPKSSFVRKEYGQLDLCAYAVNERIMHEIIGMGASVEDFLPVVTKKGEIICYQIEPANALSGLPEINNWRKESGCPRCKFPIYWATPESPTLISDNLLHELKPLNKTVELFGSANIPAYIINKELYEYLHGKYPKMGFEPIFPA